MATAIAIRENQRRKFVNVVFTMLMASTAAVALPQQVNAQPPQPPAHMVDQQTLRARAMTEARAAGRPVEITSERTESTTLWANPAGTLTLDSHAEPIRVKKNGAWRAIDPTLAVTGDGSFSPIATSGELAISGGGSGPFVTLRSGAKSLALKWPDPLPQPTVSGAIATFVNVFPGVDLQVIAESTGGFRQLIIVKNALGAANPRLDSIRYAVVTEGLGLQAGSDGTLLAKDTNGTTVFAGDKPAMWESAASVATRGLLAGESLEEDPPAPRPVSVPTTVTSDSITLVPVQAILDNPAARFPIVIDPSSQSITAYDWTHVAKDWPNQSYWNVDRDRAKVGYGPAPDQVTYRSYFLFGTGSLAGKTVTTARVKFVLDHSSQCTTSTPTDLYLTGDISRSSSVTWNNTVNSPNIWHTKLATASGHANNGCGEPDMPMIFESAALTNAVAAAASTGDGQLTFGLRAPNEAATNQWKKFYHSGTDTTPLLSVEYNTAPAMPSDLTTVPASACGTSAVDPDRWAGTNTRPTFTAALSDPEATNLTADLEIRKTDDTLVHPQTSATVPSGAPVTWDQVPAGELAVNTVYYYRARAKDSAATYSPYTPNCYFIIDSQAPAAPAIDSTPFDTEQVAAGKVGIVAVSPSGGEGDIAGYRYGFSATDTNLWAPANAAGEADLPITLIADEGELEARAELYVEAVDRAGNPSPDPSGPRVLTVPTTGDPPAGKEGDVNGDGIADALSVLDMGNNRTAAWTFTKTGTTYTPAITWEGTGLHAPDKVKSTAGDFNADGRTDLVMFIQEPGKVRVAPVWSDGNRLVLDRPATADVVGWANLANATVLAGDFSGDGKDDVAAIVGRDIYIYVSNGTTFSVPATPTLTMPTLTGSVRAVAGDVTGDNRADIVVAEGYSATATRFWVHASTGSGLAARVQWRDDAAWTNTAAKYLVSNVSGTGAADLIALYDTGTTAQVRVLPSIGTSFGAPSLWWDNSTGTSFDWRQVQQITAADHIGDSKNDLAFIVDGSLRGERQLWTLENSSTSVNATVQASVVASTAPRNAAHWRGDEGSGTTLTDLSGNYPASTVNTGWMHWGRAAGTNSLDFYGLSSYASPGRDVVDTSKSFTVSAWVFMFAGTTGHRTIASQTGLNHAGFYLMHNPDVGGWTFMMPSSDSPTPAAFYGANDPIPPAINVWTHVTGIYDANTDQLKLYIDGSLRATATRPSTDKWSATGSFEIGRANRTNGGPSNWWNGDIADLRVFDTALKPHEVHAIANHPLIAGQWNFEPQPSADHDSSGLQRTLTRNGPVVTADGRGDSDVLTFDGVDDYASYAGRALHVNTSFTVCAWAKPAATNDFGVIAAQDGTYRSAFMLRQNGDTRKWEFLTADTDNNSGGPYYPVQSAVTASSTEWTFVCGVYNAGTRQNLIYVNGKLDGYINNVPRTANLGDTTVIGRGKWTSGYSRMYWKGSLDEVRIYGGALDENQIQAFMNN